MAYYLSLIGTILPSDQGSNLVDVASDICDDIVLNIKTLVLSVIEADFFFQEI